MATTTPNRTSLNIEWEAREYIPRDKNAGWYVGLILISLVFIALSVWLKQWTFAALIVVSVIALIVYSTRPPRIIHYSLSEKGLTEGKKLYEYSSFRSFGILKDNNHFSIVLLPRKRFSTRVTVFFPEEQGEQIVDAFGVRLPMEEVKLDFLDKIVRFLRI